MAHRILGEPNLNRSHLSHRLRRRSKCSHTDSRSKGSRTGSRSKGSRTGSRSPTTVRVPDMLNRRASLLRITRNRTMRSRTTRNPQGRCRLMGSRSLKVSTGKGRLIHHRAVRHPDSILHLVHQPTAVQGSRYNLAISHRRYRLHRRARSGVGVTRRGPASCMGLFQSALLP
jgi:hypothetical protein